MEPTVTLISEHISYGEPVLDTLRLVFKDGRPAVYWAVSWRGGISHADGAGGHMMIPPEMLPVLTAKTLTDWMVIEKFPDHPELSSFAEDQRVIRWCIMVRSMFPGNPDDKT